MTLSLTATGRKWTQVSRLVQELLTVGQAISGGHVNAMAQQLMPAGVHVAALQAEVPDVPLPYSITLPHTDMLITAHRAVLHG